ncbi:transglutaminase domain-containing protein [Ktedonospora formicarum]|uniref:Transglutaminase-like domain-containing protein n=1 Tax=Ktedonospora formicarum TaxID=2778364 RepID=A0A8J3HSP8_9CHLR|nr:transglutaminase domain-containing protein [Ktedonospora formicarum]GHO42989.1 hypothetical protein KSX_11520 [Ktedonospora formicarum]
MQDAAVDRLLKVISRSPNEGRGRKKKDKPEGPIALRLGLEEGWLSLLLVAAVVYSTIWCVQAVGWVEHLNILSLTTLLGLVGGVLSAKQRRFPSVLLHVGIIAFGVLISFWQTAGAFYQGNVQTLAQGVSDWLYTIQHGGFGNDDAIFLLFIVMLGFVLAYTSAWLVYRTRSPWLMIIANAVVLLINLSNAANGYIIFLIVFLLASLLLVLRFNLTESIKRWNRQGLRYSEDLSWDIMQAGSLISIGILILSWVLPYGYTDATAAQVWSTDNNPWVQLQNTWNRIISVNGGVNAANRGSFRDTLSLGGNPNLNNELVFMVQSDDGSQYIQSVSFDTYSVSGWSVSPTSNRTVRVGETQPTPALKTKQVKQKITVVNQPALQYPYLFGASEITSVSLPSSILQSQQTSEPTAWLAQNGFQTSGSSYTVTSSVSNADEDSLRRVPMPVDATHYVNSKGTISPDAFDPDILNAYTQLPRGLDSDIASLAKNITKDKKTMYDKVVALETYLRVHYSYDLDIQKPPHEEGVSWFLFRSGNRGFCNYFASAMAIMARTQGIPARVVTGYTNGQYDNKTHQRAVHGVDAHAWTQVYFAGYGWINFEPSQSFSVFSRPLPTTTGNGNDPSTTPTGGPNNPNNTNGENHQNRLGSNDPLDNSSAGDNTTGPNLGRSVSIAMGSLILCLIFGAVVFSLWWRKLFRNLSVTSQVYGRICLLAGWAGIQLRPALTPNEYMATLAEAASVESETLKRLGDIYTRERWASPEDKEHPGCNGDLEDVPGLWRKLQPRLFLYLARHPYFLRWGPRRLAYLWQSYKQQRKQQKMLYEDL